MTAAELLRQIIALLFGGVTETATALGGGISSFITALVYTGTGDTQTLSAFFTILLVIGGVSLALSLGYWAISFLTHRI